MSDITRKKPSSIRIPSAKSEDQPATRKLLELTRKEILQKMETGFRRTEVQISELKETLHQMAIRSEQKEASNQIVLEGHQLLWQKLQEIQQAKG